MLKLMYITNRPEIAQIAESAGADRIFVDMEYIGKDERQKGLDTVKSHHTVQDVAAIRDAVETAEVLVRVNPIHAAGAGQSSSREEIDATVAAGADIIMLPYFKTPEEVQTFLKLVDGRVRTMLLVETPEAVERIDEILALPGIDEVFIGLNDLSLGYGLPFMFQLLVNGVVEELCLKLRRRGVRYGFGGIASIGNGMLPSEYIIREHYRLGSSCVILSRSFCNVDKVHHIGMINSMFLKGVREIRELETACEYHASFFRDSRKELCARVEQITEKLKAEASK